MAEPVAESVGRRLIHAGMFRFVVMVPTMKHLGGVRIARTHQLGQPTRGQF